MNSVYDPAKDAELTRELAAWREEMLAAVAKTAAPTKARMDPKTRAELRALGYLD